MLLTFPFHAPLWFSTHVMKENKAVIIFIFNLYHLRLTSGALSLSPVRPQTVNIDGRRMMVSSYSPEMKSIYPRRPHLAHLEPAIVGWSPGIKLSPEPIMSQYQLSIMTFHPILHIAWSTLWKPNLPEELNTLKCISVMRTTLKWQKSSFRKRIQHVLWIFSLVHVPSTKGRLVIGLWNTFYLIGWYPRYPAIASIQKANESDALKAMSNYITDYVP